MDPGGLGFPPVGALNDYPKFGIWTDCLYMAANEYQYPAGIFIGTAFASFSRSDMYSGAPLTGALGFISNTTDPFTMIPSNLRGTLPAQLPASGTPNYFVSQSLTAFAFEVRKFTAGPNCGGGGTLSAAINVSQTSYTVPPFAASVPQPDTTVHLDVLSNRLMQRVQYRKVGTTESLWVVHSTQGLTGQVSPQWAQIDVTGGVIKTTPVQQQIHAPDTTLHRWMGSLAVDNQGNVALGYSTSNGVSPNFPSIAYSGRLAIDPLNNLPQAEVQLVVGSGSQTVNCNGAPCSRWGDYTAMSVDPADDCTFWYTNQYYSSPTNGASGNWQTRIASFKFPSCTPPQAFTLTVSKSGSGIGTITSADGGIVCGATCFASYTSGTVITLTANPAAGSLFAGWSGGGCSGTGTCMVTVNADTTVTATFLQTFTLTVAKSGPGTGTVTSADGKIICGAACSASYTDGSVVTLTASPGNTSVFASWSGCDTVSGISCTMTLTTSRTITATFNVAVPPTLALQLNGTTFHRGDTMILSATMTSGSNASTVDGYVVMQLPNGVFVSLLVGPRLGPGLMPFVSGFVPFSFAGEIFRYTFTGAEPTGTYAWFAGLTQPGTLSLVSGISQASFSFSP
jgi:hypothetical protein